MRTFCQVRWQHCTAQGYLPLFADSAGGRALEFWRDYFTEPEPLHPRTPVAVILREAMVQLLQRYLGKYNFFLTNG